MAAMRSVQVVAGEAQRGRQVARRGGEVLVFPLRDLGAEVGRHPETGVRVGGQQRLLRGGGIRRVGDGLLEEFQVLGGVADSREIGRVSAARCPAATKAGSSAARSSSARIHAARCSVVNQATYCGCASARCGSGVISTPSTAGVPVHPRGHRRRYRRVDPYSGRGRSEPLDRNECREQRRLVGLRCRDGRRDHHRTGRHRQGPAAGCDPAVTRGPCTLGQPSDPACHS